MTVLVLGGSGQVGRAVVRLAEERELEVLSPGRAGIDLARPETVAEALADHAFDVLINCAAYTAVDAAEADPATAFAVNGYAVEALARSCAARGARLVQLSTDYVFDGEASAPYPVDAAPGPLNVYGASKLVGEALARRACPDVVVVRTSSVFGLAAAAGRGGNFVETMLRVGGERGRVRVVDDIVMAPTFAADLAAGILELLRQGAPAGTYHYTNRGIATWSELARAIFDEAGLAVEVDDIPSSEYPTPARRPRYSVLDTSGSLPVMGQAPEWRDALRRYLAGRGQPQ